MIQKYYQYFVFSIKFFYKSMFQHNVITIIKSHFSMSISLLLIYFFFSQYLSLFLVFISISRGIN